MKKMMIMAMMMVMTIAARSAMPLGSSKNAMSYTKVRNEALFLSDKMAYELNLTDAQYDAVYEINLDYLMSINGRNDVYGTWWDRRNTDLQYVLTAWQYNKYVAQNYFYRPLSWETGTWALHIYKHYTNHTHFYKAHPTVYVTYKGGNNRKTARYYADRKVAKPAAHHNVSKPAPAPKHHASKPAPAPKHHASKPTPAPTPKSSTPAKAKTNGKTHANNHIAQNMDNGSNGMMRR